MSDEARRVFNMKTVLALVAGKGGDDVSEMLGYLAQRDLSAQDETVVAPLAKGWLYSQLPELMKSSYDELQSFDEWAGKMIASLGENVSTTPIPANDAAAIHVVLDSLANNKANIAEQAEKIAGLEAQVAELQPFQGKAASQEKEIAKLKGQIEKLEAQVSELKGKTAEFAGKIPVAEQELNDSVKEIVSKAVKEAMAALPKAAPGAAAGDAAEAVVEEAAAEESGGGVPDDFGFGASGADGGGFGF